ncbi:hypothetical protein ABZ848_35860 [Streptomyces sp. NPDC047081]|uniref:hypothetical protein n=1 Tax=Streptomyces sp. NPDC047081 TaxID=3154706 RepID=UPI0033F92825
MRLAKDARDTLIVGAAVGGLGAVLLLVYELVWRFPWQVMVLLATGTVVIGILLAVVSLGDVQRDADRWESSRVSLLAWASLNAGRCETDPAASTLLAVGHRDGVEVSISCSSQDWDPEAETSWHTTVLVRLREERSPARLRYRELHRLGLPQGVASVAMGGRELRVRYAGWPEDFVALNARVDAAVRLAASLQEA